MPQTRYLKGKNETDKLDDLGFNKAREPQTMSTGQIAIVIRYAIQIVPIRRYLRPGVVRRIHVHGTLVCAMWQWARHQVSQVKRFEREVDKGVHLVRESAIGLESFQVDDENGRQA